MLLLIRPTFVQLMCCHFDRSLGIDGLLKVTWRHSSWPWSRPRSCSYLRWPHCLKSCFNNLRNEK